MAITYRVVFDYDVAGPLQEATARLAGWLSARGVSLTEVDTPKGPGHGFVRHQRDQGLEAVLVEFEDLTDDRPTRSRIHVVQGDGRSLAWVEQELLEFAASSPAKLPVVPLAALAVLEHGRASCGGIPLRATSERCDDAAVLEQWLRESSAPPIVLVHIPESGPSGPVVQALQGRLAGAAAVVEVSGSVATAMREQLGSGTFPQGAVGLVLPGRPGMRVSPATITARQPQAIARQIQRAVLEHWLRQPLPDSVAASALRLRLPGRTSAQDTDAELLEMVGKENAELRSRLQEVQDDRDLKILELDETLQELDHFKRTTRFLERRLSELNEFPAGILGTDDLPTEVNTCMDAVSYAKEYLPHLVISPDVAGPAAELDQYSEASVWAKKAWQAFLALNDYALKKQEGTFDGTFIEYCNDPPAQARPIPSAQVSLNESESTSASPACRKARTFTVPRGVEATGALYMPAHVKIQRTGSPAPRVHFWDGTKGPTGRVYVGYFGRHLPTG